MIAAGNALAYRVKLPLEGRGAGILGESPRFGADPLPLCELSSRRDVLLPDAVLGCGNLVPNHLELLPGYLLEGLVQSIECEGEELAVGIVKINGAEVRLIIEIARSSQGQVADFVVVGREMPV